MTTNPFLFVNLTLRSNDDMENVALITGKPQGPPYERLPVALNLVSRFGIGFSVRSDSYGYNDLATASGMRLG